jgi:hypothetical protein
MREVPERTVKEALHRVELEPGTGDAAWFAARQPAMVKYLEGRCGRDDGLGIALMTALTIHTAFERWARRAPPRLSMRALEQAERSIVADVRAGAFAGSQPALCELVAGVVADPPVPLGEEEAARLGAALLAVVVALDSASGAG